MQRTCFPGAAERRIQREADEPPTRLERCASGLLLARSLFVALAVLRALVFSPDGAHAEGADLKGNELRLAQALAKALEHNKELAAFEYRRKEQAGRLQQAGLVPNPELKLVVEDALGSAIYEGFDRAQTTLSLEWVLEQRNRRHRVEAARAGSEILVSDAEILRLDVAAETAQRFLSSLANQARLASADEAVLLEEDTVRAVERRVRAGRSPSVELTRAEAELATTRLARDDVTHELAVGYHRLAAQWGEVEPGFSSVSGELLELPTTESFAALTARIEQNPQLARFVSEARVAKANLRLAQARRWPTLRPSVGVRRYEATNDTALVAEL